MLAVPLRGRPRQRRSRGNLLTWCWRSGSAGRVGRMHADEADIDSDLVRRLLRGQFPRWGDWPLERVASGGTVNAIYRLGDALTVRLPLTASGARALEWEARWLHRLAPLLPVFIPFVVALREVHLPDAPRAYRGVPLATVDASTRAAIEELRHTS